jgi:hypothetical protein
VVQVQDVDARDGAAAGVDEVRREARDESGRGRLGQVEPRLDAVLPGLDRDRPVAEVQVLDARGVDRGDDVLRDPRARQCRRGGRAERGEDGQRGG